MTGLPFPTSHSTIWYSVSLLLSLGTWMSATQSLPYGVVDRGLPGQDLVLQVRGGGDDGGARVDEADGPAQAAPEAGVQQVGDLAAPGASGGALLRDQD